MLFHCSKRFRGAVAAALALLLLAMLLAPTAFAAGGGDAAPAAAGVGISAAEIPARNAILMAQDTGDILFEKDADAKVPIASITKVMTLLLTYEAMEAGKCALTDTVPVSAHSYSMGGSQIWLEPGEIFTLDEMIKAICVSSANDAAVAVAEFIGGSEPVFAEMMNQRASELGMVNTQFKNACGLDEEGHYSSARDVAIMSRELLKHTDVLRYTTIWMDSLRGGQTQLVNTNKLLRQYSGITGLKTGTTGKAGVCISATAEREGLRLISVVLGCGSSAERFKAATLLLDYGFANFETAPFPAVTGAGPLPVRHGVEGSVPLRLDVPGTLLLKKGEAKGLGYQLLLPEALNAPVEQGSQVGSVTLTLNGESIASYPVTVETGVEKFSYQAGMRLLWQALCRM